MSTTHNSGLTPEFILRHDCRPAACSSRPRADRVRDIDCIRWAPGYAVEQGYTDPRRSVLMGNWNEWSRDAADLLERAGHALEWEDEWSTCDDCGRAIRTKPDSYSWQPAYVDGRDGMYCFECADFAEYLAGLEDDPRRACFERVNPEEFGYVRVSDPEGFESGLHQGMNDDPEDILADLHAAGHKRVVFRIPETSQFYVRFETWKAGPELTGEEDIEEDID